MSPDEMLKRIQDGDRFNKPWPVPPYRPAGAHTRVSRSSAEPWLLEQLDKRLCPTCGGVLMVLHCSLQPSSHFYNCKESPHEHRWTIYDN